MPNTDVDRKDFVFKNNVLFKSCITRCNSTLIDNVDGLNIVIPMYNLLKCSQKYSMTSLWNYYRDKIDNVEDNASDGKSSEYKTKIIGKTAQRPQ